jgi:hypothetical protein
MRASFAKRRLLHRVLAALSLSPDELGLRFSKSLIRLKSSDDGQERLIVVAGHLRDNKRRMARSDFVIRDNDFLAKPYQLLRSISVECER